MPVKRKSNEKSKVQPVGASVQVGSSQLELPHLSLLQFGSDLLLKEAISAEITAYLGKQFYHRVDGGKENVWLFENLATCYR
jgi:hypothetical protein